MNATDWSYVEADDLEPIATAAWITAAVAVAVALVLVLLARRLR